MYNSLLVEVTHFKYSSDTEQAHTELTMCAYTPIHHFTLEIRTKSKKFLPYSSIPKWDPVQTEGQHNQWNVTLSKLRLKDMPPNLHIEVSLSVIKSKVFWEATEA